MPFAFLNVDLELRASRSIVTLFRALAPDVFFLRRTSRAASIELARDPRTPSEAIVRFGRLPVDWDRFEVKCFDVGYRGTGRPPALTLSPAAVAVLARTGARVAVTVYGAR